MLTIHGYSNGLQVVIKMQPNPTLKGICAGMHQPRKPLTMNCLAQMPLAVIGGHSKAVSYVRWMGSGALVSASTDNHLKLWDVDAACALQGAVRPRTVFKGMSALYQGKGRAVKL